MLFKLNVYKYSNKILKCKLKLHSRTLYILLKIKRNFIFYMKYHIFDIKNKKLNFLLKKYFKNKSKKFFMLRKNFIFAKKIFLNS